MIHIRRTSRGLGWAIGQEPEYLDIGPCQCDVPELVLIGGIWGTWHVCLGCQRPPFDEVRR